MVTQLRKIFYGQPNEVAPGTIIKRVLPQPTFRQVGPYILLDHLGPKTAAEVGGMHIPPHPHFGFSPVTLVLEGAVFHRDSFGHEGLVTSGGAQWISAGKGIVHDERLDDAYLQAGGGVHFMQIWVNTPKALKHESPSYQRIDATEVKEIALGQHSVLRLVSGDFNGMTGPAKAHSPLIMAHLKLKAGDEVTLPVASTFEHGFFVAQGRVWFGDQELGLDQMGLLNLGATEATFKAELDTDLVWLGGEPLNEPVFNYGPFVMNHVSELQAVFEAYEKGEMGSLD